MQDLEPPEVPLEMVSQAVVGEPKNIESKKTGFFQKMFSKKDKPVISDSSVIQELPELDLPKMELQPLDLASPNTNSADTSFDNTIQEDLPPMPSVSSQFEELRTNLESLETGKISETEKTQNKSRGKLKKGQNRKISKVNESSKFDWEREVKDQEILIHDNNRSNQDVNLLISKADAHLEEKTQTAEDDIFASEHQEIESNIQPTEIQEPNINLTAQVPEMNQQMPLINEEQRKAFMRISVSHQRVKSQLEKFLKNKKLFNNKIKLAELLKIYDESVERKIEDKELELTKKKLQLDKFEKHLKEQEKNIRNTHLYMKGLDNKLKSREDNINNIIAKTVETEMTRRLKIDKKTLREELNKTQALNTDLKRKVKIIEDDRDRFEAEHQKMSDTERKKLAELQTLYEKKLQELDSEKKVFNEERKNFEAKRKNVLGLIGKADIVARDLEDVQRAKAYVDTSKKFVEKELTEDKELKDAITKAEISLKQEKENLDNMMFSKYINTKLKSIKPDYLEKREDWKTALKSNPLYADISQCKKLLVQRNISEAKTLYNTIRKAFEQVQATKSEKEAMYYAIRELYNDIQLKIVEAQIHTQ